MKDRIKEILEDHKGWDDLDYIAGLIEHRVREGQREENLGIERIGEQNTAEKISEFDPEGIEYSEFAHLSTDLPDEVKYDGDGKKLSNRRVKSYGFFKNEYYDD